MKMANSVIVLLGILLCSSCAMQVPGQNEPAPRAASFNLFLQPLPQEAYPLSFRLNYLAVRGVDGGEIPLVLHQEVFAAEKMLGVQKRLAAEQQLPPGRYVGLVLGVESATLRGEEGEVRLLPPQAPLNISHHFTIVKDRPETLFLSLAPERLVTNGVLFTPRFSLWKPERTLATLKGFVSNSSANTLTVFDKRAGQVIGTISPGVMPQGMALDQKSGWLYVALAGENSVAAIEVGTGEILGKVRLRFGDEPSELALAPGGRVLVCLNPGSNSVSIIDTAALYERGRVRLSSEPDWLFMGENAGLAYVVSASAGTLTVLDLAREKVRAAVTLEDPPVKGAVTGDNSRLYLLTGFSGHLLEVDAASLAITKRIFIGGGARCIKADQLNGLLYIGKENGEIAVVDPGSLLVIDSFSLTGPVQHLTIDNEENVLFAVMPRSSRLEKIDLVGKQSLGNLELEHGSHAVVVMGER